MTRDCFIEDVNTWDELINVCRENDINECCDVYTDDDRNAEIDEDLEDMSRTEGWRDVLGWLENIPTGYDYYIRYDNEWDGTDDGDYLFTQYKERVLLRMDGDGLWDEENVEDTFDEDLLDDITDDESDTPFEESISVSEFIIGSEEAIRTIMSQKVIEEQEKDIIFQEIMASDI